MLAGAVKGGEKVGHRGGGIVYHRHDEKELNWELRGVRSGGSPAHAGIDPSFRSRSSWTLLVPPPTRG